MVVAPLLYKVEHNKACSETACHLIGSQIRQFKSEVHQQDFEQFLNHLSETLGDIEAVRPSFLR